MGLIKKVAYYSVVAVLIFAFAPGLPPHFDFEEFDIHASEPFEGNLAPNGDLDKAEKLWENKVTAPECFAIWGTKMYTGVAGGDILTVPEGKVVAHIGPPCPDFYLHRDTCSQPVGMRFDSKGLLHVADGNLGLFSVDVDTGKTRQLLSSSQVVDGKRLSILDDLDISHDGKMYISLASSRGGVAYDVVELLGTASGGLLKYDPMENSTEILLDNLHFANGVQLSADGSHVLVCETPRQRILKYHLEGAREGKVEVFAELPGLCDNIRLNQKGNYLVAIISPAPPDKHNLGKFLGNHPYFRRFILRILYFLHGVSNAIHNLFPNQFCKRFCNTVLNTQLPSDFLGQYSLVLELDNKGTILRSLHSATGKMGAISTAIYFENYLYLGSPYNKFLGRLHM